MQNTDRQLFHLEKSIQLHKRILKKLISENRPSTEYRISELVDLIDTLEESMLDMIPDYHYINVHELTNIINR